MRRTPLVIGTAGVLLLLALRAWNAAVSPPAKFSGGPLMRPVPELAKHPAPTRRASATEDGFVSRVWRMNAISAARAREIDRKLRALVTRGPAGVRAIGAVLRRGDDVDFTRMIGGELVGHRTLRQALIDTLGRIGGPEASAVALEQIRRTTDPIETVMLARILEREEPGAHGDDVIQAASEALGAAERGPARASPDVGPLFDLLASYGAVAELERFAPRWEAYALIALTDVTSGGGIPSVAALARSADGGLADSDFPLRILAQSAGEYGDAGDALLDLARAGGIADESWSAIGDALTGRELRLSRKMFDGTPLGADANARAWKTYYVEWLNVRYEEDVVSAEWPDERIDRQLALIDALRAAASSPAADEALQHARRVLEARRPPAVH